MSSLPNDPQMQFRPVYIVTDRQNRCRPGEIAEIIGVFFASSTKLHVSEFLSFRIRYIDGTESNVPFNEVANFVSESPDYVLLSPDDVALRRKES